MFGASPNSSYASVPLTALLHGGRFTSMPDVDGGVDGGRAAFQQGKPVKLGTAAWHEVRKGVLFKASTIGQQLGFHDSTAAEVLGACATVRKPGDTARAYREIYQPPSTDQQQPSLAMQWGSNYEVCGKLTLLKQQPTALLSECGFQATPDLIVRDYLPHGMLGASPDGTVFDFTTGTEKAVEIKCPFPFEHNDQHGYK